MRCQPDRSNLLIKSDRHGSWMLPKKAAQRYLEVNFLSTKIILVAVAKFAVTFCVFFERAR